MSVFSHISRRFSRKNAHIAPPSSSSGASTSSNSTWETKQKNLSPVPIHVGLGTGSRPTSPKPSHPLAYPVVLPEKQVLGFWTPHASEWRDYYGGWEKETPAPLCPLLNQNDLLEYDVRRAPITAVLHATTGASLNHAFASPATYPAVQRLRLISPFLPWTITVSNVAGVTVGDILRAVYSQLQEHVTSAEWWISSPEARHQTMITFDRNVMSEEGRRREEGVKRCDWLGTRTAWKGLMKEEEIMRERVPDEKEWQVTWVMVFEEHSE